MLEKATEMNSPCLVLAAGATHTHLLLALPDGWEWVKREVGRLRQASSHAIREAQPGRVWADGGKPIRIKDVEHQRTVFHYIVSHGAQGAWVWRYDRNDGDPDLRCAQDRLLKQFMDQRQSRS